MKRMLLPGKKKKMVKCAGILTVGILVYGLYFMYKCDLCV